ncbi:MAG: D-2-hydroxyacid dehydrogenase [Verrucomicrobiales bacterium]|jgi:phosphoglycerate dehydrogenase-like enzyme|nr:D-2-hydroxyacid dehydrogenase [Verrucomicrobiales bacterium]
MTDQPLTIWCNLPMPDEGRKLLIDELAPHRLVLPAASAASVLAAAQSDPLLLTANVAVGQPAPADVLAAPHLRWLQISTAGYTRYDTPEFRAAARAKALTVTNSSAVYDWPCAEHTLAFMLAQSRNLPAALASASAAGSAEWNELRDSCRPLRGQTALILGYGAIGEQLAALFVPLGIKTLALRRRPTGREPLTVTVITAPALPAALAAADHVINILPDSPQTRKFMHSARFAQMKTGAVFYNIGRGSTVDQEALAAALSAGRLAAAWLDVTEPEPLPAGHPLRRCPNCHVTPHTAGGHHREVFSVIRHFLDNFKNFTAGRELTNRVM